MRFKVSTGLRFLAGLGMAGLILGFVVLRVTRCAPAVTSPPQASHVPGASFTAPPAPRPPPTPANCGQGPVGAAQANAVSLATLAWAPFGQPEVGWATYAPLIGREIGTACAPETPGFAAALASWQAARRLPADGVMSEAVFAPIRDRAELRRPFVRVSAQGICPAPPAAAALAAASPQEGYSGKPVVLRAGALSAYRRMAAAARAADPRIAADPRDLTIFSGFRDPAEEAARCVKGGCDNRARATCSAHRTGLAMDLYVGQAPGFGPDSSADANRLYISRTPTYRWLVANADRFGFVPYPFEPWHWEWTGEAP